MEKIQMEKKFERRTKSRVNEPWEFRADKNRDGRVDPKERNTYWYDTGYCSYARSIEVRRNNRINIGIRFST